MDNSQYTGDPSFAPIMTDVSKSKPKKGKNSKVRALKWSLLAPFILAAFILLFPENHSGNESGKGWALLGVIFMLPFFLMIDIMLFCSIAEDKKIEKIIEEQKQAQTQTQAQAQSSEQTLQTPVQKTKSGVIDKQYRQKISLIVGTPLFIIFMVVPLFCRLYIDAYQEDCSFRQACSSIKGWEFINTARTIIGPTSVFRPALYLAIYFVITRALSIWHEKKLATKKPPETSEPQK